MKKNKNKIKLFSLCILLLFVNNVFSQIPTWNWAVDVYSDRDEVATDVEVDPLTGDVYVVGYWDNRNLSAFFPAGALPSEDFTSTYGNHDGFVAKYDNT